MPVPLRCWHGVSTTLSLRWLAPSLGFVSVTVCTALTCLALESYSQGRRLLISCQSVLVSWSNSAQICEFDSDISPLCEGLWQFPDICSPLMLKSSIFFHTSDDCG